MEENQKPTESLPAYLYEAFLKFPGRDLADYLLTHLTDAKTYQANVEVAY